MPSLNNRDVASPIIEFNDVAFAYQGTPVLQDVSFQILPGEFVGIIGPNGGGKTTLLKLILGILPPTKGSIQIFKALPGSSEKSNKVAYVPQVVRFDREFPICVEEVVLSGILSKLPWYGRFHSNEKKAAHSALEKVGLLHLAKASFGTLSGGQAQRVLIARALASNPSLLLLDEPTASVDSQAEADIYNLLSQLKGEITILMVTHDLKAAMEQVERILCVQRTVSPLKHEEVCKHFAFGLYHLPLVSPSLPTNG